MSDVEGEAATRRRWLQITRSADLREAVNRVIPADDWPGGVIASSNGSITERMSLQLGSAREGLMELLAEFFKRAEHDSLSDPPHCVKVKV